MSTRSPWIVTGSGGFVGRALLALLPERPTILHLADAGWRERIEAAPLAGAVVMHLAGRAHRPSGDERGFDLDNREKTAVLARIAARAGARRFVFLSSAKAMGEETHGLPFARDTLPRPEDAYGRSKLAAERALAQAAGDSSMEQVVVRAPIVLGARAKANVAALLTACDSPWPLPFAAVRNRRSFVHVRDLARLLASCGEVPSAAGRTYLAAHREPFSTPQLIAAMRGALGRPGRLLAVQPAWLEAAARVLGRGQAMRRLTRSLEVDASCAERELSWSAAVGLEQAVDEMVAAYRADRAR